MISSIYGNVSDLIFENLTVHSRGTEAAGALGRLYSDGSITYVQVRNSTVDIVHHLD